MRIPKAVFPIFLLLICGCMPYPVRFAHDLPNFHQVKKWIFRGGFPKEKGYARLEEITVKTVVSLCADKEKVEWEQDQANIYDIAYINIPVDPAQGLNKVQMDEIFKVLSDTQKQPLFIHCSDGKDITGAVIAIYRISVDGWSPEKAYSEALEYGFNPKNEPLKKAIFGTGQ